MFETIPRGPSSTNSRLPAACIASISATNSTGLSMCSSSSACICAGLAGYGLPVWLDQTGKRVGLKRAAWIAPESAVLAGATSWVWKAPETGSIVARKPAAESCCAACSTWVFGPEITHCSGALWLAMLTPAKPLSCAATASRRACTAAMPPGSETLDASAIARPRTADSCRNSAGSSAPAASSAVYSP